jgi:1-deoxy-D-xylulose-5-phosphate reductoisomerase
MTRPLGVALLGATGSIGESTLAVIQRHPERFRIRSLAGNRSVDALAELARRFRVDRVVVADEASFRAMAAPPPGWSTGREALLELVEDPEVDVVLNAVVGAAGLEPTLRALAAGKRVALANKESLVAGGDLVRAALAASKGSLVPVDSEHSAILQCLEGARRESISRILLTASGGPFRGWSPERLRTVTAKEALQHPTWSMGSKITVDSATLAHKALEVIEAHVLYQVGYDQIDAVVHPQSVVHSFVEFVDGSVLAQLGFPTMEVPILYALTWPERLDDPPLRTFDPLRASPLTFEAVDHEAFPLFGLGVEAGRRGGTAPTAFNAANEVAVEAFLAGGVTFPGMARIVEAAVDEVGAHPVSSLEQVLDADLQARRIARHHLDRQGTQRPGAPLDA